MKQFSLHDEEALRTFLPSNGLWPLIYGALEKALYRRRLPWPNLLEEIPQEYQRTLNNNFFHQSLRCLSLLTSPEGDTIKFLFQTQDGHKIESVIILQKMRSTLCVSSQAGCSMDCLFCATARLGLKRNLWFYEILEQVDWALNWLTKIQRTLTNVVFMGMGEPLLNYEQVSKALGILTNQRKFSLAPRRITLSTCGIVPQILRFGKDFPQISLAVSLHSSRVKIRALLMPTAALWTINELMKTLDSYVLITGKRVFYEYIMIAGVTDIPEMALELGKLLEGRSAHVNLIPFNGDNGEIDGEIGDTPSNGRISSWQCSDRKSMDIFQKIISDMGIPCTVRSSKGDQIAAACGQLVNRI